MPDYVARDPHNLGSRRANVCVILWIFMVQTRVRWLLREALTMAIFQRDSDRDIGRVGMRHIDWGASGPWLASRVSRG